MLFIFLILSVGAVSATNDAVEMSTVGLNDDCVDVNVYNNINASQIQSSDVSSNSDALKSVVNNNESSFGENLSGNVFVNSTDSVVLNMTMDYEFNVVDNSNVIDTSSKPVLGCLDDAEDVLGDSVGIKTIFEGVKVYNPGDVYSIKFVSSRGEDLTGCNVFFSVNNLIIGFSKVGDNSIASFRLPYYISEFLTSANCTIETTIYGLSSNNVFDVKENVTIGTRSLVPNMQTVGSIAISKWQNVSFERFDDGYRAYVDDNTYRLIDYSGNRFIVHDENVVNVDQLRRLFSILSSEHVRWDIVRINLSPVVYNINFDHYSDREWKYALKWVHGQLIFNGNGASFVGNKDLNFLMVGSNANIIMNSLTLNSFNHCFFNHGYLYCCDMNFVNNEAYKFDIGVEESGAVIHNYNVAEFRNCNVDGNQAKIFGLGKRSMGGAILYAEPHSTTYFSHLTYSGAGICDESFYASRYSSVVFCNHGCDKVSFFEKYIGNSFFHPLATLSFVDDINVKDTIAGVSHPVIFNCRTNLELAHALRTINNYGAKGSEIIINLVNRDYHYSLDEAYSLHEDWSKGFCNSYDNVDYRQVPQRYFLNAGGFYPITINGNGAHIEISNNDADGDFHFAFIGKGGHLTLNNLRLSKFNTVFMNALGNLVCNNCVFTDNAIDYGIFYKGDFGGVLRSYGASTKFVNCTFSGNRASHDSDIFYAVEGSNLIFDNCNIVDRNTLYGNLEDSGIRCPLDMYSNHITYSKSWFVKPETKSDIFYYQINSTRDFYKIDFSKHAGGLGLIDFNCNCTVNVLMTLLSFSGTLYMRSNGFDVNISVGEKEMYVNMVPRRYNFLDNGFTYQAGPITYQAGPNDPVISVKNPMFVPKNTCLFLDGFTFNGQNFMNYGGLFLSNCILMNCTYYNSYCPVNRVDSGIPTNKLTINGPQHLFCNMGVASLTNCQILNNDCEFIFDNTGSLTLVNTTLIGNCASKYGLIYNNGGSLCCINTTFNMVKIPGFYEKLRSFSVNSLPDIYNFRTSDCVIVGGNVGNVVFEEPMESWKLDLIQAAFFVGTAALSGFAGYSIGAALGPSILNFILAGGSGALIGGVMGSIYGTIESNILHDYSHMWTRMASFAGFGFTMACAGFALGSLKYKIDYPQNQNLNPEQNQNPNQNPNQNQNPNVNPNRNPNVNPNRNPNLNPNLNPNQNPNNINPNNIINPDPINPGANKISVEGIINRITEFFDPRPGVIFADPLMQIPVIQNTVANYLRIVVMSHHTTPYLSLFDEYFSIFDLYYNTNTNVNDWLDLYYSIDSTYNRVMELINSHNINNQDPNNLINNLDDGDNIINEDENDIPNFDEDSGDEINTNTHNIINDANANQNDNQFDFRNTVLYRHVHETYFAGQVILILPYENVHYNNESHIVRVINLMNNFYDLYNVISSSISFNQLPDNLRGNLELFNRQVWSNSRFIPSLFDDRHSSFVNNWESIYNECLMLWNSFIRDCNAQTFVNSLSRDVSDMSDSLNNNNISLSGNFKKYNDRFLKLKNKISSEKKYSDKDLKELMECYIGLKKEFSLINKVPKGKVHNVNIVFTATNGGGNASKPDIVEFATEARDKAKDYILSFFDGDEANKLLDKVNMLFDNFNKKINNQNYTAVYLTAYNKFIRDLNDLFAGVDGGLSDVREVSINCDEKSNLYDYMFNVPKLIKSMKKSDSIKLLYENLLILKLVNPSLYNVVLMFEFKGFKFNDFNSFEDYFNDKNVYDVYMNIFKRLGDYRNNTVICSNENTVIFNMVKYRADVYPKLDCYSVLDETNRALLCKSLLKECKKMIFSYEGQKDTDGFNLSMNKEIYDRLSNVDLEKISKKDFDKIINLYYDLWSNPVVVNPLDGVNPNDLSNDELGKLIIDNMARILLIGFVDTRLQHRFPTLWTNTEELHLSYIQVKVSILMKQNTLEARAELLDLFKYVKDGYDYLVVWGHISPIKVASIQNHFLKYDVDMLLKYPNMYKFMIPNIVSGVQSIISGMMRDDLINESVYNYWCDEILSRYVNVYTKDVLLFYTDIHNYLAEEKDLTKIKEFMDNRVMLFEDKINSYPNAGNYHKFIKSSNILFDKSYKFNGELNFSNSMDGEVYGSWEKIKELFPDIAFYVDRTLIKGDLIGLMNKYDAFTVRDWIIDCIKDYLKIDVNNYQQGNNYVDVVVKQSTDYRSKDKVVLLIKEAYYNAEDYCNAIRLKYPSAYNILLKKVVSTYDEILNRLSNETSLDDCVRFYNIFVKNLNKIFMSYSDQNLDVGLYKRANVYNLIFNLPNFFNPKKYGELSVNEYQLFAKDLLVLKMINPSFYNAILKNSFNNQKINDFDGWVNALESLGSTKAYALYMYIFNKLGNYRNNNDVNNSEGTVLVNNIMYRSDISILNDDLMDFNDLYYKILDVYQYTALKDIDRAFICEYLFKESFKMIKALGEDKVGNLINKFNELPIDGFKNLDNKTFKDLVFIYQSLWLLNDKAIYLGNVNLDELNDTDLGKLIINNLAKIILLSGEDSKFINRLHNFKISDDRIYLSYAHAKVLNLVKLGTKASRMELINLFKEFKSVYDSLMICNYIHNQKIKNLPLYLDSLKKSPGQYGDIIDALDVYDSVKELYRDNPTRDCLIDVLLVLGKYSNVGTEEVMLLNVDLYNYLVGNHPIDDTVAYLMNRVMQFKYKIYSDGRVDVLDKLSRISDIIFNGKYVSKDVSKSKSVFASFYGSWDEIVKVYPDIGKSVNKNLFKGDIDAFLNKYGLSSAQILVYEYIMNLINIPDVQVKNIGGIDNNVFDDIKAIIVDGVGVNNVVNVIELEPGYGVLLASWEKFDEKYPESAKIVLDNLLGGDLEAYISEHGVDKTREDIMNFVSKYLVKVNVNNKDNSGEKQIKRNNVDDISKFMDIKQIMENKTIISNDLEICTIDGYMELLGSWNAFNSKYPDTAGHVLSNLLNGDLKAYVSHNGVDKTRDDIIRFVSDYLNVKQNLINDSNYYMRNFYNSHLEVKDLNPYNNIFNYKNHFNKLSIPGMLLKLIDKDLNALKVIDFNLYNKVISSVLFGKTFKELADGIGSKSEEYKVIVYKSIYNRIFDMLSEYRDNGELLNSESSRFVQNAKFNAILEGDYVDGEWNQGELNAICEYYYDNLVKLFNFLEKYDSKCYDKYKGSFNKVVASRFAIGNNYDSAFLGDVLYAFKLIFREFSCVDPLIDEKEFIKLSENDMGDYLKQRAELIFKFARGTYDTFRNILKSDFVDFNYYIDGIIKFDNDAKSKLISIFDTLKYHESLNNLLMGEFKQAFKQNKVLDYDKANLFISPSSVELLYQIRLIDNINVPPVTQEKWIPFLVEKYNEFVSKGYKMDLDKLFNDNSIDNRKLNAFYTGLVPNKEYSICDLDVLRLSYKLYKWNQSCPYGYRSLMDNLKVKYGIGSSDNLKGIYADGVLYVYTGNGNRVNYCDLYTWVSNEIIKYIKSHDLVFDEKNLVKSYFSELYKNHIGVKDTNNPYNNVFNFKMHFNKIMSVESLRQIMKNDLDALRNINNSLYNEIMSTIFHAASFNEWMSNFYKNHVPNDERIVSLKDAYNKIFDRLSEFRDNDGLLQDESSRFIKNAKTFDPVFIDLYNQWSPMEIQNITDYYYNLFINIFNYLDKYDHEMFEHNSKMYNDVISSKGALGMNYTQKFCRYLCIMFRLIFMENHFEMCGLNDMDMFKSLSAQKMADLLKQNVELLNKFDKGKYDDLSCVVKSNYVEFANYVDGIVKFDKNAKDKLIGIYEFLNYIEILENVLMDIKQAFSQNKTFDYNQFNLFISQYAFNLRLTLAPPLTINGFDVDAFHNEKGMPFIFEKYNEIVSKGAVKINVDKIFKDVSVDFNKLGVFYKTLKEDKNYSIDDFDVLRLYYKVVKWSEVCPDGYNDLIDNLKVKYNIGDLSDIKSLNGTFVGGVLQVYTNKGNVKYSDLYTWVSNEILNYINDHNLVFDWDSYSYKIRIPKVNPNVPAVNPDVNLNAPKLVPFNEGDCSEYKQVVITRGGVPVMDVNVGLKNYTNVLDGIFNTPLLFSKNIRINEKYQRLFYNDLMLLKLYNHDLYVMIVNKFFKKVNSVDDIGLSSIKQLNDNQFYDAYSSIFDMLGSYRDNSKIMSNQKSIIIDKLKHDQSFSSAFRSDVYSCYNSDISVICSELLKDCENMIQKCNVVDQNTLKAIDKYKNMNLDKITQKDFSLLVDLYYKIWGIDSLNNCFADVDISKLNKWQLGDLVIKCLNRYYRVFDGMHIAASQDIFVKNGFYLSYWTYYVSYLVNNNTDESAQELIKMFYIIKEAYCVSSHSFDVRSKVDAGEIFDVNFVLKYSNTQYCCSLVRCMHSSIAINLNHLGAISGEMGTVKEILKLVGKYGSASSPYILAYYSSIYNYIMKLLNNDLNKKGFLNDGNVVEVLLNNIKNYIMSLNIKLDDKYFDFDCVDPSPHEISVDMDSIKDISFKYKNYIVKYDSKNVKNNVDERVLLQFEFSKEHNTYVAYTNGNFIVTKEYYINDQKPGNCVMVGGVNCKPDDVYYNADGKAILGQDLEYMAFNGRFAVDKYGRCYYNDLNKVPETKFVPEQMYYYANGILAPCDKVIVTEEGTVRDVDGNRLYSHLIGDKYEVGVKYYRFDGKLIDSQFIRVDYDGYVHDIRGNLLFKEPLKGSGFPVKLPSYSKMLINGHVYATA